MNSPVERPTAVRAPRLGTWELLLDADRLVWSAETLAIFGLTTDTFGGDRKAFLERVHPDDRKMLRQAYDRRLASAETSECEYRILLDDGGVRRIRERGEYQPADATHPRRLWGTVQDVTSAVPSNEDMRAWEQLAHLASRVGKMGAWMLDLAVGRLTLSSQACTIHGAEPGYSPTLDEATDFYAPASRDAIRHSVEQCMTRGNAFDIEAEAIDVSGKHLWVRAIGEAERDASGAIIRIQGALQDITRRKLVEATLRDSLAALREVYRIARIGTWEWSLEADAAVCSRELYEMLGVTPAAFTPGFDSFLALVHADDRAAVVSAHDRLMQGETQEQVETRIIRPDGALRWMLQRAEAIRAADGSLIRIVGTTQDLTEQHLADAARESAAAEIGRLNRLYSGLTRIRRAMVRIESRDSLLQAVCDILVEEAGFEMAWVGWNDAATHQLVPVAAAGDDEGDVQTIRAYSDERPAGGGPAGRAFRERRPVVLNDLLANDTILPWREFIKRRGLHAVSAFPIYETGKPCGVLVVYANVRNFFQHEEVALIEAAAADLSAALGTFQRARRIAIQEARLREAQAVAHIGSWELDVGSSALTWTDETHSIFETDARTFRPTYESFLEIVHPDDRAAVTGVLNASLVVDPAERPTSMSAPPRTFEVEHRILLAGGRTRDVHERWRIFRDADGAPVRAVGTGQDVTEQNHVARALHAVAEDNRALARSLTATLESITDAFYTLDREWRFTYVNHEAERIMVRRRDELLGRSLHDLFPGFADTEFGRQFAHALRGDQPVQFEAFYPPLARWFEARAFPSAQGLAVYFRDITPERTSAAQLRALMLKVESVQDAERSAIARDVHDELGQALTVLRMDATRLSRLTAATPAAAELVAEMTAAIDHTLQEARSIATALHPTALDDLGLNAAVEIHATQVARRAGLALTLDLAPTSLRVDRARAGAAYRVLQESLTNVVRHAAASSVVVRLGQSGSDLVLEIADDGRGMPPGERRRHGSLGLLGMRERAVVFGGSVDIGAASSGGTVVTLRLPLASLTSDVGQGPTRSSDNVP